MKLKLIFLTIVLFFQAKLYAETIPAKLAETIEKERVVLNIPGASVAVIDHGKIIWTQGFGYADLTTKRKVDEKTLFQAASITKTLTAAAVLKLLKNQDIALDEPVNRYLSDWQIPANQYSDKVAVTFRLLLNHTAAISNPYPKGGYGPKDTLPTLLETFKGIPPATNLPLNVTEVPGTSFHYCNGCYTILQGAMENISHSSYPNLMKKSILEPANMTMSRFDNDFFLKDNTKIAIPYDPNLQPYANAPMRSPIYATGLLWTTAEDLAKYNIAVTQALNHDNDLISRELALELITPSENPTHGLGFYIGDKDGNEQACGKYIFHTGANIGYLTLSMISKDGQQGAVVLINVSPSWDAKEYPQFDFVKYAIKQINQYYGWG